MQLLSLSLQVQDGIGPPVRGGPENIGKRAIEYHQQLHQVAGKAARLQF
jgi:hypothetical protein